MLASEKRSDIRAAAGSGSLWPDHMSWVSTTTDRVLDELYEPVFAAVGRAGARLREYDRPRVTTSLLYIVVTVLVLLTLLFLPGAPR
jgi:hypothetical protein